MKEVNKGILDNDMVISTENVQRLGEVIALTCIKTVIVRSGKNLHYLYKGLLRDINRSKKKIIHRFQTHTTLCKRQCCFFANI